MIFFAGALELGLHHGADLLRRVVHAVDVGRLDQLDLAAELVQAAGDQVGDLGQAFDVLAARFDGHQIAQGVEQRLLFLLGEILDGCDRLGQCGASGDGHHHGEKGGGQATVFGNHGSNGGFLKGRDTGRSFNL